MALTRRALGLTQVEMARLMGSVGVGQAWANYEAGLRFISIHHALALTQNCGIPLDWIYQGSMGNLPADLRDRIQQLIIADKDDPNPGTGQFRSSSRSPRSKPSRK